MPTPAQLAKLIAIAAHLSGYPVPVAPPPPIHEVDSATICAEYGSEAGCDVVGLFKPVLPNGEIWIDVEWVNSPTNMQPDKGFQYTEDSYLIHELTHWLQFKAGAHRGSECIDHLLREKEAYAVQNAYELTYEYQHKPAGERGNHEAPPSCGTVIIVKLPTQEKL